MFLIALAAILVLGIAYFQVVQGLYGALIMTILTVLSAAMAFNFYEPLASAVLYERQPAYADAIALVVLFVIPLLVLRLITDKLLPSNVVLGVWADRIGGGVLGLLTATIMVGVLLIAVQMLPLGETILGYTSHDTSLQRDQRMAPFYPDEFTIGLVNILSRASLGGGDKPFRSAHDDLLLELFCARNTAGKMGRVDALPNSVTKVEVFAPGGQSLPCELPANPLLDASELQKPLIVRVTIDCDARDADNWLRLPATHFRLIAADKDDESAVTSYYPVGFLTAWKTVRARNPNRKGAVEPGRRIDKWHCQGAEKTGDRVQLANLTVERRRWPGAKTITIDWVYQIRPDDIPGKLVFRRTARKAVGRPRGVWPSRLGALARVVDRPKTSRRNRRRAR